MAVLFPRRHPANSGLDSIMVEVLWLAFCCGILAAVLRWRKYGYLLAAFVAQVAFTVKAGGDWMTGARFLEPVIVAVYVFQILGLVEIARLARRWLKPALVLVLTVCAVATTSLYALTTTSAPVTRLNQGVSDQSLVRAGGYPYSDVWAQMPQLLSCARPGDLVAVSEAGYGAFSRRNLRILDLRGLTSRQIARAAAPSTRGTAGVGDQNWWRLDSPVGRVIVDDQPRLIVTVDGGPATVLADRYVEFAAYGAGSTDVYLYEQNGMSCPLPPVPDPRLVIQ
jgi:hypothetical protein